MSFVGYATIFPLTGVANSAIYIINGQIAHSIRPKTYGMATRHSRSTQYTPRTGTYDLLRTTCIILAAHERPTAPAGIVAGQVRAQPTGAAAIGVDRDTEADGVEMTKPGPVKRQYECPYCYAESRMHAHSCPKCGTTFFRPHQINRVLFTKQHTDPGDTPYCAA